MDLKIENVWDSISSIMNEMDNSIEKELGDISAIGGDVYPFIYDFYTTLTNMNVVHKRFDIKRYYIQYDIFPESFLNVPFVRGIRISPALKNPEVEEALATSLVHLNTIKKQGKSSGIWSKSKGTFLSYGNIKKINKISNLVNYVMYFNSMYAKPLVEIKEKNELGRVWYYDKIYPNPFSYFYTQLKSGASVLIVPFTGFLITKLIDEALVSRDLGGGELMGKIGISYILATTLANTKIKYLGPYNTFFPNYEDFKDWKVNTNEFLIDYYIGFIVINGDRGYLLNNKKDGGFIMPIMSIPFSEVFYAYAIFGNHYCDKINTSINVPLQIGKISLDIESINHFKNHLRGVKHKFKKKKSLEEGYYNNNNLYINILNNYFEEIKIVDDIIIDPTSYLYLKSVGITKEDIVKKSDKLNNLLFGNKKDTLLKIARICDLKNKYINKVRNLIRDNHLYLMI